MCTVDVDGQNCMLAVIGWVQTAVQLHQVEGIEQFHLYYVVYMTHILEVKVQR